MLYTTLVSKPENYCLPFLVNSHCSPESRSWFGGSPPVGVVPKIITNKTEHVATLELTATTSLTLFTSLDYDTADEYSFDDHTGVILDENNEILECIFHPHSQINVDYVKYRSSSMARAITLQQENDDKIDSPRMFHKFGGYPFLEHRNEMYEILSQLSGDYRHFFQLSGPARDDKHFAGNWFQPYRFHLYLREQNAKFDWKACWG